LSRLKTDKASVKNLYFYNSLLTFGTENLEASRKPGGKKAVYERNDLRDIADQFGQSILDGDGDGAGYADQIEKYSPARAAQIRAKFKNIFDRAGDGEYTMRVAADIAANARSYSTNSAVASNSSADAAAAKLKEERESREKREKELI